MKNQAFRQRLRQTTLIIMLLSFPVIMNYLSPYIILDGASQGIINGSFIIFTLMFLSALFIGRLWCGWACPDGGLAEVCFVINNKPVNGKKIDWIKWLIWIPWVGIITYLAVSAGGYSKVNFFHLTENVVSLVHPMMYIIYYIVIGAFMALAVIGGRRAGCHAICWMAPFMILGRKVRNLFRLPALRLVVTPENCIDCKKCTRTCPMSLDVNSMVRAGQMEHSECILCGSCVDTCPQKVIRFSFSSGK